MLQRSQFFLVVPIGLEEAAKQELLEWLAILATEFSGEAFVEALEVHKGGVEFEVGEQVGLCLNRCLKIPSRILQRLRRFTTRDWKMVESELKQVEWKKVFPQGICDWEIAASASKINNEKHLLTLLESQFKNKFYQPNEQGATAYLRVHDNQFILSRDTSGEHLHFRGYRKQQGEAPLRENFAAFMWAMLTRHQSRQALSSIQFIDPFVGSGTLVFESMLWNKLVQTRNFASDNWLKPETERKLADINERLQSPKLNWIGVDRDQDVLSKAENNAKVFGPTLPIKWVLGDSTDELTTAESGSVAEPVWLMSNPPYGGKGRLASSLSWREIWTRTLKKYKPQRALALGPEREARKGDQIEGWTCVEILRFLNGGIRVAASVWEKTR